MLDKPEVASREGFKMPEEITPQDAEYALDIVKAICAQVGPGLPGTSQEHERAEMIKKELVSHLGEENVLVEEFSLAPGALLGSQLIAIICMLIAVLLNLSYGQFAGVSPWATAIPALLFSILAVLLFTFEFLRADELVDALFKKKQSVNVIGTLRKPGTANVKRLLILSGHHDSALEFIWLRFTGYGFLVLNITWLISLITIVVMNLIQLIGMITNNAGVTHAGTFGWVLLVYPIAPSMIYALFFARGNKGGGVVPGAADNLSACAIVVAMCRFLKNNPSYIPDDTEIRFITFGSEEAGVRGSKRYVACHLEELKRLDVRLLNYETIANRKPAILTSESNGTVRNSPEMVKDVIAAARQAGIPFSVQPATLGTGSDAGPFSKAGLKATTLLGFNLRQMVAFYHQDRDTPDVVTLEPLFNAMKLTLEWIRQSGK